MKKELPLAIENFPDLIRNGCYYVDKTAFIKPLLTAGKKVRLITRPRRFGKTLFMDMLKSFLQIDWKHPRSVEGHQKLFADLAIANDPDFCRAYMGQFPVISLTLKDVEGAAYGQAYAVFAALLESKVAPYRFLLESPRLDDFDKASLGHYLTPGYLKDRAHEDDAKSFLKTLTIALSKHFERQVVLLVDEYDVPLAKAAQFGYYKEMLNLIRAFLGQILKEPQQDEFDATAYVRKAVLTGCLRVSKESVFTGINNFDANTVCSEDQALSEAIGFNAKEVKTLLGCYGLSERFHDVKHWYDGYRFAGREIYCPWDVINFADKALGSGAPMRYQPENYWEGTSGNEVIDEFLGFLPSEDADLMQVLVDGGEVDLTINDKLTYSDFAQHESRDFWTLLLYSGYLTVVKRLAPLNTYRVKIPNEEILDSFNNKVKSRYSKTDREFVACGQNFAKAALEGNCDAMAEVLVPLLENYVSVRDAATRAPAENYYHGFLMGLLSCAGSYARDLRSNAEAGNGYSDIVFTYGVGTKRVGVVIEIKRCENSEDMYDSADDALKQIQEKHYAASLDRLRCGRQYVYGIAFCRKDCAVVGGERAK